MGLSKNEKIELGGQLYRQYEFKKNKLAVVLGFHRNSFYTRRVLERQDKDLVKQIEKTYETDDTLGHKKLAKLLEVNKKRVLRVMKKYGVRARRKRRKYRYGGKANIIHPNLLTDNNFKKYEVVFSDIFEFRLADGSKVYCCFIIRWYTRQIVSFSYGYTMKTDLVLETLSCTPYNVHIR